MTNIIITSLQKKLLLLFLVLSFTSVNLWSSIPILNSQIERIVQFLALIIEVIIIYKSKLYTLKNYRIVSIFIVYAIIGVLRGIFVADCYWEYNQLTIGTMSLSLPLLVYIFESPSFSLIFYRKWLKYCIPAFFIFFYWVVGATQFFLGPIFLLGCFIPILPKKWKILILILLILMGMYLSNRSQVIKVVVCLIFSFAYYYKGYIPIFFLRISNYLFYILPLVLLFLGISGKYNVFSDGLANNKNQYKTIRNDGTEENLNADTRTFIFEEVIESAVKHDYILLGRTPALGNDSDFFYDIHKNTGYSKKIRYMNELCHTNIFTWLGIVGVILYSLIYFKASWLAIYRSNSFALKLIGCYIAFNWMFGWIENMNRFDISNIFFWGIIAIAFSKEFRNMNDLEFKNWFKHIFK